MPQGRSTSKYAQTELTNRMTLPLTAQMREFLRDISANGKRQGGRHIDGTQILRALITVLMEIEDRVDWDEIQDEEELTRRLLKAFTKKR